MPSYNTRERDFKCITTANYIRVNYQWIIDVDRIPYRN